MPLPSLAAATGVHAPFLLTRQIIFNESRVITFNSEDPGKEN